MFEALATSTPLMQQLESCMLFQLLQDTAEQGMAGQG